MKHNFTDEELRQVIDESLAKQGVDLDLSHLDETFFKAQVAEFKKMLDMLPEPAKMFTVSEVEEAWDEAQHEFGQLSNWEDLVGNMQNQLADFAANLGHTFTVEAPAVIDYEDVQPGDRVKIHTTQSNIYEVTVASKSGGYLGWDGASTTEGHISHIELIKRAEQPKPDPAKHLVIMVERITSMAFSSPRQAFWDGTEYIIQGWQGKMFACVPEKITKWRPAEVVEKVNADG